MTWQHWVNALLGAWLVVLTFLGLTGATLMWTIGITGALIVILGVWGALGSQSTTNQRAAYS
jgi:hypothetical protein